MKLYIIGNGFDRNHDLDTDYEHYKEFLYTNYYWAFSNFEQFQYIIVNLADKWSDLEELFEVDYETCMADAYENDYPDLSSDSDSRWSDLDIGIET